MGLGKHRDYHVCRNTVFRDREPECKMSQRVESRTQHSYYLSEQRVTTSPVTIRNDATKFTSLSERSKLDLKLNSFV